MLTRFVEVRHPDADLVRKARWLNRVLLSFILTGSLGVVGMLLWLPFSAQTAVSALIVPLLVGLYALSRRGFVTVSLVGLLILLTGAVLQAGLALPNFATLSYPALFVLVIITVGVFLSARAVFAAVVCVSAVTIWYYQYSSAPGVLPYRTDSPQTLALFMYTLIILFVGAGGLSWLSSRMMGETLNTLRRRAAELEAAYRELAEQSQREHALGTNIGTLATQLSGVSSRQVQGVGTARDGQSDCRHHPGSARHGGCRDGERDPRPGAGGAQPRSRAAEPHPGANRDCPHDGAGPTDRAHHHLY
jgi:hypothetical protein